MLQIAIGRRIFDTGHHLSDSEWLAFQQTVEELVQTETGSLANTKALGVSEFLGQSEDTCLFVWFEVDSLNRFTRGLLADVVTEFQQFSIALTFGETEFLEGV